MSSEPAPVDRFRTGAGRIWLGTALGLALILLALLHIDLSALPQALRHAQLWPWLPLAVLGYLSGHLLRGVRLKRLVSRDATLSTTGATGVVAVGYAANNLLPFRFGELVRAAMLAERTRIGVLQALVVTVLERVLDGLAILALLALTGGIPGGAAAPVLMVLALAFFACAFLGPPVLSAAVQGVASALGPRLRDHALQLALAVSSAVAYLRRLMPALGVLALSLSVWLCESSMYLALLKAKEFPPIAPPGAVYIMASTNLGLVLPDRPGFQQRFEAGVRQALASIDSDRDVAEYATLVHATFFLPITLLGVAVLVARGIDIATSFALQRAARRLDGAVLGTLPRELEPGPAPEFVVALVEALLPEPDPGSDGAAHKRIEREVADFVHGQLESLPSAPRLLLGLGFFGFRALVRVTHLRGFANLPRARRRAIVERWAYGGFAPARHLFRAARATAHLAFYEHPGVRHAL